MGRRWTDKEAINFLTGRGAEIIEKSIFVNSTLGGLTAGSALDYLKNYCKYKVYVGSLKEKRS